LHKCLSVYFIAITEERASATAYGHPSNAAPFHLLNLCDNIVDATAANAAAEEARHLAEGAASETPSVSFDINIGAAYVLLAKVIRYQGKSMVQGFNWQGGRFFYSAIQPIGNTRQPLRPSLYKLSHNILAFACNYCFGIYLS